MADALKLRNVGSTYGGLTGKTKADFGRGSASFVTFLEVINNTRLRGTQLERVTTRKGERQNRVQRGDILFNGSSETPAEVALSAVVDFDPDSTTYLNSFCFGYRLKTDATLDPTFLAYFFRSRAGRELVSSLAQGATRYNIAKTKFLDLELDLPTLPRQREIVRALSDADDTITAIERLITKKQEIKRGMMQQLLTGRIRLPGFAAAWREKSLSEVGSCYRGVGYDPDIDLSLSDKSWTVRLLRSNNVHNGEIDLTGLQFVHERRVVERQFLASNDIVVCMANGSRALVGKAALFSTPTDAHRYTFGAFMGTFRVRGQRADPRFIAELMQSKGFRDRIELILSGSSINNLRPGDIESFTTLMPDVAEQTAIADVLTNSGCEITALRHRLGKARATKAGMMQQLLTGRTSLPEESA